MSVEDSNEAEEVMIGASGYGLPPHLDNWLVYQQNIGVKFIHMNVDPSFLSNINKSPALRQLLEENFVRIVMWPAFLNSSQVYYFSQTFRYQDCIYRYHNIYKFMMVIDFDLHAIRKMEGR